MIEFTYEGKKYEFRGEYRVPKDGDCYLVVGQGSIGYANPSWPLDPRAIVHPVPETLEAGGIVWEVLGERKVKPGEWLMENNTPDLWALSKSAPTLADWPILRPLRLVEPRL